MHPLPHTGSSEYRQITAAQKFVCFSQMKTHLQNFLDGDLAVVTAMNQIRQTKCQLLRA
jgi:hypothetical protein